MQPSPKRDDFKSPPTPLQLNVPDANRSSIEPPRREPKPLPEINPDDFELPRSRRTANNPPPEDKDLHFFRAAQRSYGQKRPPQRRERPIPSLQERERGPRFDRSPQGHRLGRGARARQHRRPRYRLNPEFKRKLTLGMFGVMVFAAVAFFVANLVRHNALAVYLDDAFIGYIAMNRELEASAIQYYAEAHHSGHVGGAGVIVDQEVIIRPARASSREILGRAELMTQLSSNFTYQIEILAVYVNGRYEVSLRTHTCVDDLANRLRGHWATENTVYQEFVENWEIRPKVIDPEEAELLSPQEAFSILDRTVSAVEPYVVQDGENLSVIALRFATTVNRIAVDNNIPTDRIIRPGDVLQIATRRPLLSVRTIDEFTSNEEIPMETIINENPNQPSAMYNVVTQGRDGEKQVTRRVYRINGVEYHTEIERYLVLRPAITHVVEVGTGEAAIIRR